MFFISGDDQVRLGLEEIIEGALVDPGPLADLFNADRAVAVLMDEIKSYYCSFSLALLVRPIITTRLLTARSK